MTTSHSVVYIAYQYETLLAFFGAFPTTEEPVLKLRGPVTIRGGHETHLQYANPRPVYDTTRSQLIVLLVPLNGDNPLVVHRIGKHFQLQANELMPKRKKVDDKGATVLSLPHFNSSMIEADSGLLSLGCWDSVTKLPFIVQKRTDPQNPNKEIWNEVPLNLPTKDTNESRIRDHNVLVRNDLSASETIYHLSDPYFLDNAPDAQSKSKLFYIDTVPSHLFSQLYRDTNTVWRRHIIRTEHELWWGSPDMIPVFTYDQTNRKPRLYIFQVVHERGNGPYKRWIQISQVDLRQDGTVPGFGSDIKPTACWSVSISSSGESLCVLQHEGSLLATWSDQQGSRLVAKLIPFDVTTGLIDNTKEWTDVSISFEGEEKIEYLSCGVVVPNEFVED